MLLRPLAGEREKTPVLTRASTFQFFLILSNFAPDPLAFELYLEELDISVLFLF